MAFHPFEVNVPHLAYTILGGFVVVVRTTPTASAKNGGDTLIGPASLYASRCFQFGLFSLLIKERLYIGEAVIATVVGIAFGERCMAGFESFCSQS
jgi:hypothetical protein